ncbi:unnamed protein product [Lampetra planeri]
MQGERGEMEGDGARRNDHKCGEEGGESHIKNIFNELREVVDEIRLHRDLSSLDGAHQTRAMEEAAAVVVP